LGSVFQGGRGSTAFDCRGG